MQEDALLDAYDNMDDCIIAEGYPMRRGYIYVIDKDRSPHRSIGAHRKAWLDNVGPIPPGMCVLHACDNPPCINIAHLFLGTKKDNFDDMVAKGRGNWQKPGWKSHIQSFQDRDKRFKKDV